ncbi:hypothetical protein GPALN_012664 [Globodera pallida]|nr:hypothetical protein GPALN_012664 [Globodera pallida]
MTFNAPISSPVTVSSVLLALLLLLLCRTVRSSDNASTVPKPPFADWLPGHSQTEGGLLLLDRRSLAEGEVLLFRTKKSRHRAIAVMTAHHQQKLHGQTSSRFADALTFKEWLRRVYREDKALKVSVRTTEVVRPVLQHLYATRAHFRAPIIVHANTFESAGTELQSVPYSPMTPHRHRSKERPVDALLFVESVRALLPDAVISLGWTRSEEFTAVNRLDWTTAFQLIGLLHELGDQPAMLNMHLNDAVHSSEVLQWLLGVQQPHIYLVLKGDFNDFVDSESPLTKLARIGSGGTQRLLFDVDEKWRSRIRRFAPGPGLSGQKQLYGLEPSRWMNWLFSSSSPILSTSMLSPSGVAFLGWPNSLLLSSRPSEALPSRQTVTGRVRFQPQQLVQAVLSLCGQVMFIPKRQSREVIPQRRSGMVVYLFHTDPDLLFAPRVPHSVQAFIGFDGRILLENNAPPTKGIESDAFAKSSSAQLPRWPCYAFSLLDKGWRVELEVWTERCSPPTTDDEAMEQHTERPEDDGWVSQRTFLQMDTPVARNRLSRHVAVGKSGDGAIDFLVRTLRHNGASPPAAAPKFLPLFGTILLISFLLPLF